MDTIAQNGLLRKEHYLAGFVTQIDDHVVTILRNGRLWQRYTWHTSMEQIHHEIDQVIEIEKACIIGRAS